jgi:3-hydroxymyristoyl/3-hydroxydecanoyl-(acyl carrier protein) dehydratase
VTLERAPEIVTMLRAAARRPLLGPAERCGGPTLDGRDIEGLLPHRGPLLLIDRIEHVDRATATIVCRYDLERAAPILEGHFPGRPMWPGVLQVEAIGQAGVCLVRLLSEPRSRGEAPRFVLTHILGAEFVRPVTPTGHVQIVARASFDGLFVVLVGQCLQHEVVCCAAAVRGISEGSQHES